MSTSKSQSMTDKPIIWIWKNVELRESNSVESLFDKMESQSGELLMIIYQPFDGSLRSHFVGRGQILDFAVTLGSGHILDFGPGDGWPSLLLASMVDQITGVDGSDTRVGVCRQNAQRMGVDNAEFHHVSPGEPLPFDDDTFDGVCATSSIEQTPDPKETLQELHRVLKPGGVLRFNYESLSYYAGTKERELKFIGDDKRISLLIFERNIEKEYVQHYRLELDLPRSQVKNIFIQNTARETYQGLSQPVLAEIRRNLKDATEWTTHHPSCKTYLKYLREIGFSSAKATHNGGTFAGILYDKLDESERPEEIDDIDTFLLPLIEAVVELNAPTRSVPGKWDHWITAVK